MDQGCLHSPAFFALGLADALDAINARLRHGALGVRVSAYLDDVVVVIPAAVADEAHRVVCEELGGAGLTINADKTAVWTADPARQLPAGLARLQTPGLRCLGATVPWVDPEDPLARFAVHGNAYYGDAAAREA